MSNTNKLYKLIKLLPNSTIDNFQDKINENIFIGTTDFEKYLETDDIMQKISETRTIKLGNIDYTIYLANINEEQLVKKHGEDLIKKHKINFENIKKNFKTNTDLIEVMEELELPPQENVEKDEEKQETVKKPNPVITEAEAEAERLRLETERIKKEKLAEEKKRQEELEKEKLEKEKLEQEKLEKEELEKEKLEQEKLEKEKLEKEKLEKEKLEKEKLEQEMKKIWEKAEQRDLVSKRSEWNIQDLLNSYFSITEPFQDGAKKNCENTNKKVGGKDFQKLITPYPDIKGKIYDLVININRTKNSNKRLFNPIDITNTISYNDKIYNLASVICHRGSGTGGHYIVYALRKTANKGNKWYQINDLPHIKNFVASDTIAQVNINDTIHKKDIQSNCVIVLYRRDDEGTDEMKLPVGQALKNVESSCYMNSLLQLLQTTHFYNNFNDERYSKFKKLKDHIDSMFACEYNDKDAYKRIHKTFLDKHEVDTSVTNQQDPTEILNILSSEDYIPEWKKVEDDEETIYFLTYPIIEYKRDRCDEDLQDNQYGNYIVQDIRVEKYLVRVNEKFEEAPTGGTKKTRKTKKVRKHGGVIQLGGRAGKLRKGFKYTGNRTKTGLAEILKL